MTETLHRVCLRTYNEVDPLLRRRLSADVRVSHAKLIEQAWRDDAVIAEIASQLHAFRSLRNALGLRDTSALTLTRRATERSGTRQ